MDNENVYNGKTHELLYGGSVCSAITPYDIETYSQAGMNLSDLRYMRISLDKYDVPVPNEKKKMYRFYFDELINYQVQLMKEYAMSIPKRSNNYITKNILFIKEKYGLLWSDYDRLLQVSKGYTKRCVEDPKRNVSADTLALLADIVNVNVDDLINRNLATETNDLQKTFKFIGQLYDNTVNGSYRWQVFKPKTSIVAKNLGPALGNLLEYEESIGMVEASYKIAKDIYYSDIQEKYIWVIYKEKDDSSAVFFYVTDKCDKFPDEKELLFSTESDETDSLRMKAESLYKEIELNKNEFVLTNKSSNFIENFLDSNN